VISDLSPLALSISLNNTASATTSNGRRLSDSSATTSSLTVPADLSSLLSANGFGASCAGKGISINTLMWAVNPYQSYANGLESGITAETTVVSISASDCNAAITESPFVLNGMSLQTDKVGI
jgi:hypothetical protein